MAKVLGLDVSSSCTGYCIVEDGYLLKNTINTIIPNEKSSLGQKLVFFEKVLRKIISKYNPDHIIIEDIFKGPNAKTFKTLAMFRGVAFKVVFEKIKKDPICVMPTEARKMVGVNGITKEDAFEYIINRYNFTDYIFDKDNDKTDAIVLALSYDGTLLRTSSKKPKIKRKKKK
jgi:Holliday junction resolvasome RuvABC endonuclease subunit